MIKFSKLYKLLFGLVVVLCFLIGGSTQFFLGIPNIVYTIGVLSFFLLGYGVYVVIKKKIILDKVVSLHLIMLTFIFLSAIYNSTSIVKTLIFLIFVLVPISCYLFFKINSKEDYISKKTINTLFLVIAMIQLPVVLVQKFGYDFLIGFNRSSQLIAPFDFMFGTFFLKADHSLGFFLLFNIINIYRINKAVSLSSKLVIGYLLLTIFIGESNVSKLLAAIFILFIVYNSVPNKIRIIGLLAALVLVPVALNQFQKIEAFEKEVYFIKNEYNPISSYRNYERGIAKRAQVVISYSTKIPLKIMGDGPYSYFNVLKGEFTKTKHFSQLIWSYADLGLIGLVLTLLLLYAITLSLGLSLELRIIVFSFVLVYAFMTTIFSDLAIMVTFIGLLQNKR